MRSLNPKTVLCCIAIFLLSFFLSMRIFNGDRMWKHVVTSDGRGYYAYLPALLIDNDLTFSTTVEKEKKLLGYPHYKPGYLVKSGDHILNKYFAGEALLLLPFFLLGMLFTILTGNVIDGYSFYFQFFTGLGSLFYLVLGLNFLRLILQKTEIRREITILVIIAITAGTNLFYYTLWQPTMSHVFSFFTINGFLWFSLSASREWRSRDFFLMVIFLALTCLVRPTNGLVILLIPFMAGSREAFTTFLKNLLRHPKPVILSILAGVMILCIQPLLWYLQTGQFFVWSYADEGFRFGSPEFMNVLFSFRKGLFIYTPLILVSLGGMIVLLVRSPFRFSVMLMFLVLSTWVIASWWSWYYGDGFGLRAFIDYYGIFAILLAMLIRPLRGSAVIPAASLLVAPLIFINLFQTWQYVNQIIQPNSMNREKYCHVFLRADSLVFNSLGGNQEIPVYSIDRTRPVAVFSNNFEQEKVKGWDAGAMVTTARAFSGKKTGYLDSLHPYSTGIKLNAKEMGIPGRSCYIEGKVMVWDSAGGAGNGVLIVFSMTGIRPGENYWEGYKIYDVPHHLGKVWRECTFSVNIPVVANPEGVLKVYLWQTGKKPVLVDDFEIRVFV